MKTTPHAVLAYLRSLVHHHADRTSADGELLRRFGESRDEDAFAALLRRHGPMILNAARRLIGDEQLAEDVFQATFLLLARKASTIRRVEALPCWLHGVVRRLAVQARRAHVRRREKEAQARPLSSADPLEELSARELVVVLDAEIGKLPESQRAALILCCLEGLSQEEAAKRLCCSVAAVKGRLERGRNQLRQRLEKRGLTLPAVLGGTLLVAGSTSPVPAALTQATLQAATIGSGIAPTVAALLEEAMRTMWVTKLQAIGVVVMLLAFTGAGAGMLALGPQGIKKPAPSSADTQVADKPLSANKRVDLYGDPLPEGAVMRLGTLKRRAIDMQLAVTADGKSIVGARHALCLSIWDAATGELRQTRELPESWGSSVLSPDGRWLAQGCLAKHPLVIWDVRTVEKLRVLGTEESRKFWPIAFSRDSKHVAAVGSRQDNKGGYDHLIRVWNLADGKEIFRTELRHKDSGGRLAFSPDGNRLLASFWSHPRDKGLYCWAIAAGRQAWLNEDKIGLHSMVITADNKVLTSPGGKIVDLTTGRTVTLEKPPPIPALTTVNLTLTPDGRTLLIPTGQGVIVWDMVHGKELRTLPGPGGQVVVMPDGKSIITNDGSIQRWDLETGKPLWSDTFTFGHTHYVGALAFSADGRRLASISQDGSLRLWDAVTGRPLRVWHGHDSKRPWYWGGVQTVDITPDGRWLLSPGDEKDLKLWDASSDKVVRSLALPPRESDRGGYGNSSVLQVQFSADGNRAVGLLWHPGQRHRLATWDLKTGQLLACHWVEHTERGFRALSADGRLLLCNGVLIDTASGTKLARLEGASTAPYSFSRDGALVCGGSTRTVQKDGKTHETADGLRVWESATGKIVAHVPSKPRAYQAAFHPNNRLLVTNADDIQFYDVLTGKLLAVRRMPKDVLSEGTRFTVTADGRRLATGMLDGTILLWDVSLPVSKPQHLEAKEIESLWTDLADDDAAKAWRAVWRMAEAPQDALTFLRPRIKPDPTAPAEVTRKLLADLDSDSFETRQVALNRLKELGLQAEPALRASLESKPSLEQRRRIEEVLADLPKASASPAPEELRQLRALIVLERIDSPEARQLLAKAAKGPESTRRTRQARAVLACLP